MYPTNKARFDWADEVIEAAAQTDDAPNPEQTTRSPVPAVPPKSPVRNHVRSTPIPIKHCPSKLNESKFLLVSHEETVDSDSHLDAGSAANTPGTFDTNEAASSLTSIPTEPDVEDPDWNLDVDDEGFFGACSFSSADTEEANLSEDRMIGCLEDFDSDDSLYTECRSLNSGEDDRGNNVEDEDTFDMDDLLLSDSDEGHQEGAENDSSEEEWINTTLEVPDNSTLPTSNTTTIIIQSQPHLQAENTSPVINWLCIFRHQGQLASERSQSWVRYYTEYTPTPRNRVKALATQGVKVTDHTPTWAEVGLLEDPRLSWWRCPPSKLRHAWSYL